ncbi:MAG: hypothetical protein JWQ87_4152 [Candidatus Sulfotelmatobacter sp.]|nr:hypothetical protein [Candidatus Sulfotelmatobacter sp.]
MLVAGTVCPMGWLPGQFVPKGFAGVSRAREVDGRLNGRAGVGESSVR